MGLQKHIDCFNHQSRYKTFNFTSNSSHIRGEFIDVLV